MLSSFPLHAFGGREKRFINKQHSFNLLPALINKCALFLAVVDLTGTGTVPPYSAFVYKEEFNAVFRLDLQ